MLRYNFSLYLQKYLRYLSCFSITIHQAHRQKRAYSTRAAAKEALQILYPPSLRLKRNSTGVDPGACPQVIVHPTTLSDRFPYIARNKAPPHHPKHETDYINRHKLRTMPEAKSMEEEPARLMLPYAKIQAG